MKIMRFTPPSAILVTSEALTAQGPGGAKGGGKGGPPRPVLSVTSNARAMEGHVIGKAAYVGRFHTVQ